MYCDKQCADTNPQANKQWNVFTARLWLHSNWHTKKRSHIFAKSHTERHRATLASSICFLRAVIWVVCICMHRCDRCWQLLMSDCKVLIMTAADSYLNFDASKTLPEGQNQTQDYIISLKIKKKVYDYSICALINAVILTLRNVYAKQSICWKNILKNKVFIYIHCTSEIWNGFLIINTWV